MGAPDGEKAVSTGDHDSGNSQRRFPQDLYEAVYELIKVKLFISAQYKIFLIQQIPKDTEETIFIFAAAFFFHIFATEISESGVAERRTIIN